jgi:hypothetical protein
VKNRTWERLRDIPADVKRVVDRHGTETQRKSKGWRKFEDGLWWSTDDRHGPFTEDRWV